MRRAARVDANHAAITDVLRTCGAQVLSLAAVGKGCPDLLVYSPGRRRIFLVEVKNGSKRPSARKLTEAQKVFHLLWPVMVISSEDEAVALAGGA